MIPAIKINPLISRSTFLMIYCPFGCAACQAAPAHKRSCPTSLLLLHFRLGLGLGDTDGIADRVHLGLKVVAAIL